MAKLKLDVRNIKATLTSRKEILGLVAAGVLVVLCVVYGLSTLVGASSPEGDIQKDAKRLESLRKQGEKLPKSKEEKNPWEWNRVPLTDPHLALFPVFERGVAGSSLRIDPRILMLDDVEWHYLHKGIHSYQVMPPDNLQVFATAAKDEPPVVLTKGIRMVVVSGTFPYHAQVDEYRSALRLDKVEEVFAKSLAPTFEGLNVERKKIAQDGKEVAGGDWEPLYKFDPDTGEVIKIAPKIEKLLKEAVYDERWVDSYYDVIYGTSATPLPLLANNEAYPKLELPGIVERPPPPPKADPKKLQFVGKGGPAPVSSPFGTPRPDHMPPEAKETRQSKNEKIEDLPPDLRDQVSGKFNLFSPYGNTQEDLGKVDPSRALAANLGPKGVEASSNYRAPLTKPANPKALVQFIDVDVEPGATYQYRIKVRLANPNFEQPAGILAYAALADGKERLSDWFYTRPITIPGDDFLFYITNQDKVFVSKVKSKEPPTDKESSTKAIGNKMVPFQIHRFVDIAPQRDKTGNITSNPVVADWTVAERLLVARGEPIGRKCEVEMVVWNQWRTKWEFHDLQPATKSNPKPTVGKGLAVDFRVDPPVVLLDFTGGKMYYHNPKAANPPNIEDDSEIEALVLMPDMTMKLRNAREDADDRGWDSVSSQGSRAQERRKRYEAWKTRLDDFLNPPAPTPPKTPGKGF